eukprot:10170913-Alexandrium_andersonii.AAC.1
MAPGSEGVCVCARAPPECVRVSMSAYPALAKGPSTVPRRRGRKRVCQGGKQHLAEPRPNT